MEVLYFENHLLKYLPISVDFTTVAVVCTCTLCNVCHEVPVFIYICSKCTVCGTHVCTHTNYTVCHTITNLLHNDFLLLYMYYFLACRVKLYNNFFFNFDPHPQSSLNCCISCVRLAMISDRLLLKGWVLKYSLTFLTFLSSTSCAKACLFQNSEACVES